MAFMNKAQVEEYARMAHLDLGGMTWQQKQKAISEHMRRSGGDVDGDKTPVSDGVPSVGSRDAEIEELKRKLAEAEKKAEAMPQVPVMFKRGKAEVLPTIEDYENVTLIASPEQRPTQHQRGKWYEELGTQKNTKEVHLGVGRESMFSGDESGVKSSTYVVEDTDRKVIAESTMPKYSCLLTYRPTKDLCAVAEYGGHRGYLWTHHRLPNIKAMLQMMDAYEEFKDRWRDQPGRLFYLGGLLCCDISFTESMMKRIQKELRKRDRDGE